MPTPVQYGTALVLAGHGYVHVVYVASSRGWFGGPDDESGWRWSRDSWLSGVVGPDRLLDLVSALFVLVALGFTAGALGSLVAWPRWEPVVAASAVLSIVGYGLLWDGRASRLAQQGTIGVVVDLVVLGWLVLT